MIPVMSSAIHSCFPLSLMIFCKRTNSIIKPLEISGHSVQGPHIIYLSLTSLIMVYYAKKLVDIMSSTMIGDV